MTSVFREHSAAKIALPAPHDSPKPCAVQPPPVSTTPPSSLSLCVKMFLQVKVLIFFLSIDVN